SFDVDTGNSASLRQMRRAGLRPPADAVSAVDMRNPVRYGHSAPASQAAPSRDSTEPAPAPTHARTRLPVSGTTGFDGTPAGPPPWDARRQLLMIGIKGFDVTQAELPPANLVLLIDTSGSMHSADKLPLLKQAFAQLVPRLRAQDRVSIVVYAGSAGLVLPPT